MRHFIRGLLWIGMMVVAQAADLPTVVAIQPLGPVKQADIQKVKAGIEALYTVTVEVLPEKPLPKVAYYPPRDRYKADDIIDVLANEMPASVGKIIGLTARDISTTNDEGNDWGIMGLGQLNGKACVVSTFRLRAGKAGEKLFSERLVKVANHELGHTFGVDHCDSTGCFMQAARGKIATVDAASGKPCAPCTTRLPLVK